MLKIGYLWIVVQLSMNSYYHGVPHHGPNAWTELIIWRFACIASPLHALTHYILVNVSTVICWTSPFVILGVSGLNIVAFILFVMEYAVSKQCRP